MRVSWPASLSSLLNYFHLGRINKEIKIMTEKFLESMHSGYGFAGASVKLGAAMLNGQPVANTIVQIPLKTMNRHGLIAGATGTGKTKTLQLIAEELSGQGVPCLMMDIKGDLSGIARPGAQNPKITERQQKIGLPWHPSGRSVEFLTLSGEKGARMRATVTEFGPVLFSRILGLNDTQQGVVSIVFKYCDDMGLPLLDLKDFKKVLNYLGNEGKDEIQAEYGMVSPATLGSILRKTVELEQQGADQFFGELSFDVEDLMQLDENGHGQISIVRLTDIQDRPKLFSTFMLQLLAEIYSSFPEAGDIDQPKLCIFIDEAHLVFQEASDALLQQVETMIKLIRSKGVGVFFITQAPTDIPRAILAQLGLKVQHALRAFTAVDRKNIKMVADNYPTSEYYDTENLLTQLGIGEAFVTALNEKGIPTPLAHTMVQAPKSRMDVLTPAEIDQIVGSSPLVRKYNEVIDRESAFEMLAKKIESAPPPPPKTAAGRAAAAEEDKSVFEKVSDSPLTKQIGRTVVRELTRGLLGVLGLGGRSSTTRRKTGWF
jgi:uncharacterized protein